jgi:hypothetical protein
LQAPSQPAKLRVLDSGPDATGINEPADRVVIRQQERSEPGTRALGIGPANHHELLAVLTLDLEPQAAMAGRIGSIGALGDDPSSDSSQTCA